MTAKAARAVARGPAKLPPGAVEQQDAIRVYVWDVVVRLAHWAIFLAIVVLVVTGLYIGKPYLIAPGEAHENFVMGTMRTVHFLAATVFAVALLARIVWMFIGSPYARWHQFIPVSRKRRRKLWQMLGFYTFIRKDAPAEVGHNALAGGTYVFVYILLLLMVISGLGLYAMDHPTSIVGFMRGALALFGGAQTARFLHHIGMWLILGFFVHHLASAMLMSSHEKNGLLGSIFSGYKWVRRKDIDEVKP